MGEGGEGGKVGEGGGGGKVGEGGEGLESPDPPPDLSLTIELNLNLTSPLCPSSLSLCIETCSFKIFFFKACA